MSLAHSSNTVTDGLAMHYDMGSGRSFKGAPTTNLVATPSTMASFNNYSNGPTSTFITEFGTTGWRMNSAGSWNGCYTGVSIPSTGTYTFSAWYRYWGGSGNNNGATCYVSGWGGGDSAAYIDKSKIGIWQRISITLNVTTTSLTLYLISYGGTSGADNSTWDVTMPQVEAGSFATTFGVGTRSNTQSLVDVTGNTTFTATSLTYASDNTFSFSGSNYISMPSVNLGNGNVTWSVSAWVKTTTATNDLGGGSVMSNSSGGPVYSMMGVNNGKIVYWTYQGGWVQKLGVKTVNDNIWHMLTWVNYSNNTMDMYVDGILDTNVANSTSGNNNPVDRIGGSWAAQFVGSISSVSRYTKALSAAEVRQNFSALRGRFGV